MEASPNQNTQPIKDPERTLYAHIDETLADYDRYVLDHKLAVEGVANEITKRTHDENGD